MHHRTADKTWISSTNYNSLFDSLRANDYMLASISCGNTWGNQDYIDNYVALYNYIQSRFYVDADCYILSASMGALAMLTLSDAGTIPISSMVGIIPVINLEHAFEYSSAWGQEIADAYSFNYGDADLDTLRKYADGYDPYADLYVVAGDTTITTLEPVQLRGGSSDDKAPIVYIGRFESWITTVSEVDTTVGGEHSLTDPSLWNWNEIKTFFNDN